MLCGFDVRRDSREEMMGRGRARKVENGVLGGNNCGGLSSGNGSLKVPSGPVFYPSEEEFKDPLEYLYKIRPEAEPYGICKIVPPASWKPPFALDMQSFTFPTKSQAIHQLQARCAPCDPKTFILEYSRFLEERCGKKAKKRIVFDGEDLDLCKLFNVVKRFGGYDNVAKMKKWGEVSRFIRPGGKISECSKHVLSLLYLEHLLDYEEYYSQLNKQKDVSYKHGMSASKTCEPEVEVSSIKRRRKNKEGERVELRKVESAEHDQICEQCRSGLHGEVMLLCDRCNRGWHTYCLSPPLKRIPPGNWYCLECLNSEKDSFGFVPGKQYSLEAFRRVADRVKKKWFGSLAISWVQVEKKFWEIVEGSVGEVEVMYGSDLDTSQYGSGFPCRIDQRLPAVEVDDWNKYCTSPWNLNNLPRLKGSMLRAVHQNIAGVMVPWLYVGMLFSSFCWHFEDHCLYSMNYHHWGEPKCWYSVPGNEAHAFEEVMRSSLPDLFEAQPDLLFQLVTMLNPSVLQEKGVPVYSIVQEPGNFVITFPRSYHGGFNLGLNCAEAVNFAPADWLPHGGFGAELYRLYRKIPVLSHEELLLVVSKGEIDGRVSPYLIKELLRVYDNEKSWRERLWKNGIIKSSPMTPRLKPDYVGTEEDPMCVICQQLLYLSAVYCNCRPSTYVCLEHWEHLCECKRNKLRLLYRHSLAELAGLLHEVDKYSLVEAAGDSQNNTTPETAVTLMKKVRSGHVTHLQLAEDWIVRSCKILEQPYSRHAYVSAIEEAEQFLWAGPEMDLVREIQNNLIKAQSWANSVRDCLSKLKSWSRNRGDTDRVQMTHIIELLNLCTLPCKELSYYYQLKEYEEKACKLTQEIKSALTLCSEFSVADLENLYAKAAGSPIYIMECEQLKHKLSSVKVWVENVRYCISQKAPCTVDIDMVYKLELEMLELQHQLPEVDLLTNLIRQVKSCQSRCNEILKDPISLKELKLFLSEWEDLTVNIPELEILRKYYSDTISWISRVHLVLEHVHEREDQEKVVDELTCIQKEGLLLQIKVDELPRIEHELNKARCRVKAFKVLRCQMSLDFVQQLISEATTLQIENEKLFVDISQRQAAAVSWEEKARYVLATRAPISDFDDIMRESEDICVVPPSLLDVKLAVSTAKEWLVKAQPYLSQDSSILQASESYSPVDVLKGLVLESEDLKVYLEECAMLKNVLKMSVEWEQDVSNLLQNIEFFLNIDIIGEGVTSCLLPRLEDQVISIETSMQAGVALSPQFNTIWRLQDACSILKWCIKAVSFSLNVPTCKEVEMTLDAAASVPRTYKSCALPKSLINVLQWLKKALEILEPNNHREFDVSCVEEQLDLSKKICVSFPFIIGALQDAAQNHNMWLEQIHLFFALSLEDRTWDFFLQLKESGSIKAFKCEELEKVLLEYEKVVKWKQCCVDIIGAPPGVEDPLLSSLTELKSTIESSYQVYSNANNRQSNLCLYCSTDVEDQDLSTCSICKESFHLRCMKLLLGDAALFVCTYCNFINSSRLPCTGYGSLRTGSKPIALKELIVLLSDANELCLWTEERRILNQIVEKALECNTSLMELVNFMLAYVNKDLDVISQKICIALKAIDISGVWDEEVNHKFELALARNSWKIRADKLLQTAEKPTLQQIQSLLKEGLEMSIPSEDYFNQKLTYLWKMGLQWAETANKVSMDGGVLELHRVFELISEGEHLPVSCSEELKLLRDRSMLYCICRRPYDQRAMIACDKCDEWYHFDCVEISSAPKFYQCPACDPHPEGDTVASAQNVLDRCAAGKFDEPQTPLRRSELRRNSPKRKPISKKILKEMDMNNNSMRSFTSGERLLWRQRKPFSRAARKRSELQSLSPFFHVQNK